jgi:predicted nucleotidyltransferase
MDPVDLHEVGGPGGERERERVASWRTRTGRPTFYELAKNALSTGWKPNYPEAQPADPPKSQKSRKIPYPPMRKRVIPDLPGQMMFPFMEELRDTLSESKLSLRYHGKLNSKLWSDDCLKPEVQKKLVEIGKYWIKWAKLPKAAVIDMVIVGGNANYNYTKQSDIDLHIVFDDKKFGECPELRDEYLKEKKQLWALTHDVKIYGHPVEIYAQKLSAKYPKNQGIYSILEKKWVLHPEKQKIDLKNPQLLAKVDDYTKKINHLIQTDADEVFFDNLKEKFRKMRTAALEKGGEFSFENLVFKELRNRGLFDKMNSFINKKSSKNLSLGKKNK